AAADALVQQRLPALQEAELGLLDRPRLVRREELPDALARLLEVLAHVVRDRLARPEAAGLLVAARPSVEAREVLRDPVDVGRAERARREPRVRAILVAQAAHVHRAVDDLALSLEAVPAGRVADDREHAPVD